MTSVHPVIYLIDSALQIYSYAFFFLFIVETLINMGFVNSNNRAVENFHQMLLRFTMPAIKMASKLLPPIFGIDLSPILLMVLIDFLRYSMVYYFS